MTISSHSFKLTMDLKEFKKETGLTRKEFNELNRSVKKLETPLEKMRREVDLATIAYKKGALAPEHYARMVAKLRKEEEKAARTTRQTSTRFGAMKKEIGGALSSMTGLSTSTLGVAGAFAAAGVASVKMGRMIRDQWEELNEVAKFSDATGFSENFILSFQRAAKFATTLSSDQINTGLQAFTRNLGNLAATGTGEAGPALEVLGLRIEDLQGLDSDEQLKLISTEFSQLGTMAEKSAVAVKLFGEQGQKMIPLLEGGAAALNQFQEAAARRGLSYTKEELALIEQNLDRIAMVEEDVDILKKGFAMEAAKAFDNVAGGLAQANINMKDLGETAFKVMIPIYGLADALGKAWIAMDPPPDLAKNTKVTTEALKEIEGIETLAGGAAALMAGESAALMSQKLTTIEQVDQKIAELREKYGDYGLAENEITKLQKERDALIELQKDVDTLNREREKEAKDKATITGLDDLVGKRQQDVDFFGFAGRDLEIAKLRAEMLKEERAGNEAVAAAMKERLRILEDIDSQLDKLESKEEERNRKEEERNKKQAEAEKTRTNALKDLNKAYEDFNAAVEKVRDSIKTPEQKFKADVAELKQLLGPKGITQDEYNKALNQLIDRELGPLKAAKAGITPGSVGVSGFKKGSLDQVLFERSAFLRSRMDEKIAGARAGLTARASSVDLSKINKDDPSISLLERIATATEALEQAKEDMVQLESID